MSLATPEAFYDNPSRCWVGGYPTVQKKPTSNHADRGLRVQLIQNRNLGL